MIMGFVVVTGVIVIVRATLRRMFMTVNSEISATRIIMRMFVCMVMTMLMRMYVGVRFVPVRMLVAVFVSVRVRVHVAMRMCPSFFHKLCKFHGIPASASNLSKLYQVP